jgi:hypothetical protein
MNYDDPRIQALKKFLLEDRKLSIMTVKAILYEVAILFDVQSKY